MKKIIFSLIGVLFLIIGIPVSAASEKVLVYVFSKDGCPACIAALEYFDELEEENPDLFEIVEIVVYGPDWKPVATERQELLIELYKHFDEDTSSVATPTIAIGEYLTVGLPQDASVVYDEIIKYRDAKNKVDVVKNLADENKFDLEQMKIYTPVSSESKDDSAGKYDAVIIIGIFVFLIGGFAGLVIVGKK